MYVIAIYSILLLLIFCNYYFYIYTYVRMFIFTTRPFSPDIAQQILPKLYCCYSNLDSWKIIGLIATKFQSFVFSVLGFTFAYVSNINIIKSLCDFCLFPACFLL
jgi:hypothetical protein